MHIMTNVLITSYQLTLYQEAAQTNRTTASVKLERKNISVFTVSFNFQNILTSV